MTEHRRDQGHGGWDAHAHGNGDAHARSAGVAEPVALTKAPGGTPAHAHGDHGGHAAHDKHAGHSPNMFRDLFWVSLLLTIPTV
ncbi:MAG TPA: hypothetical protein VMN78_08275, partial [Longimicrobiales bacterium]|nr:hypothetical protein [Longimicrobiales bacterium]